VAGLRGISGAISDVARWHASPLAPATSTDVESMIRISHGWCYSMAAAERQQTRHRNCEHWINKRVQPGWASGAEEVTMMIELPATRIGGEQVFIK
jgi:hypothetical protein